MPTAFFSSPSRVQLCGAHLEIREQAEGNALLREIPLSDLDRVIYEEQTQITTSAMAELLRRGIPVSLIAGNQFLGGFLPAPPPHGAVRLLQYRQATDPAFALTLATRLVEAKINNQRRVLQRLASRREIDCADDLRWLENMLLTATRAATLDELRGCEGAASARYFQVWARFLPPAFPFERRSTRPPRNAVNSCISFAATLLYYEMTAALHARGLDPAIGTLHSTDDRRWSLALDLIEPFRPVFVEALALDLFSHQILKPDHFDQVGEGIFLNREGRPLFFLQYERRMERQFFSEHRGHRTTLRQQIDEAALEFKSALDQFEGFRPFLMN